MRQPPVEIGRDEARREAAEELLRPRYEREGWWERLVRTMSEAWHDLLDAIGGGPGSWLAAAGVALALAVLVAALVWALRGATRDRHAEAETLLAARRLSAAEHRAAAEQYASAGRWADALRERMRAIAVELEDRGVVTAVSTRTAGELAAVAGVRLPDLADDLGRAARLFDDVAYGEATGTPEDYGSVSTVDERLRAARSAVPAP